MTSPDRRTNRSSVDTLMAQSPKHISARAKPRAANVRFRVAVKYSYLLKIHACNEHWFSMPLPYGKGHRQQKRTFLEQTQAAGNPNTGRVPGLRRRSMIPNGSGIIKYPHNMVPIGDGP